MRYYLRDKTLIIRGNFFGISSGTGGGIKKVTSILNHTVPFSFSEEPEKYIQFLSRRYGLFPDTTFGLLTAVDMDHLVILKNRYITVFITAGITNPDPQDDNSCLIGERSPGTINIISVIDDDLSAQALVDSIITITEAKASALCSMEYKCMGTTTDAVITAARGEGMVKYAGSSTLLGKLLHESVFFGVRKALLHHLEDRRSGPEFYILSTIGSEHWVTWSSENCPYYPCHFQGQRCDFCYCPLYPCQDERLGLWINRSGGAERIWSCTPCTLNHQPAVVDHLKENPQASLEELIALMESNPLVK